ncbi:hypothetical protein WJX72_007025 [[Myrmecia] bisecta]|uniref:beta-fructofuranosidase n=1 Tax=[Myrmecia] bisecta TaxID=41462 RepID=A0AAW1PP90_9CHLO
MNACRLFLYARAWAAGRPCPSSHRCAISAQANNHQVQPVIEYVDLISDDEGPAPLPTSARQPQAGETEHEARRATAPLMTGKRKAAAGLSPDVVVLSDDDDVCPSSPGSRQQGLPPGGHKKGKAEAKAQQKANARAAERADHRKKMDAREAARRSHHLRQQQRHIFSQYDPDMLKDAAVAAYMRDLAADELLQQSVQQQLDASDRPSGSGGPSSLPSQPSQQQAMASGAGAASSSAQTWGMSEDAATAAVLAGMEDNADFSPQNNADLHYFGTRQPTAGLKALCELHLQQAESGNRAITKAQRWQLGQEIKAIQIEHGWGLYHLAQEDREFNQDKLEDMCGMRSPHAIIKEVARIADPGAHPARGIVEVALKGVTYELGVEVHVVDERGVLLDQINEECRNVKENAALAMASNLLALDAIAAPVENWNAQGAAAAALCGVPTDWIGGKIHRFSDVRQSRKCPDWLKLMPDRWIAKTSEEAARLQREEMLQEFVLIAPTLTLSNRLEYLDRFAARSGIRPALLTAALARARGLPDPYRRCIADDCGRSANYGMPGGMAVVCSWHKLEAMINTRVRMCEHGRHICVHNNERSKCLQCVDPVAVEAKVMEKHAVGKLADLTVTELKVVAQVEGTGNGEQEEGGPASPAFQNELEEMLALAEALKKDPERPIFHVSPRSGWINDPNAPIYAGGKYHLFYQHIINGCEWDFGIVWGHAVSTDLVHWEHLPPALMPTPGGADADGCFSGCCAVDHDGTPTILYTGVRLRSNPECGPLPPAECDLNLPFIETQCSAFPDPSDPTMATWVKGTEPVIATPPPDMPLVGWRDPFIFEIKGKQGNGHEWGMLMGSGTKGRGGAVMVYRSSSLATGWRYDGMLCEADTVDTGAMWECPLLVKLDVRPDHPKPISIGAGGLRRVSDGYNNNINNFREVGQTVHKPAGTSANGNGASPAHSVDYSPSQNGSNNGQDQPYTHLLCVSPDAPTNPVLYWLGNYDEENTKFLLEDAKGPLRLDLGDVLYAPNLLIDEQGRHILWGWLQERRKVGSYDYAGCLSVPRVMHLRGSRFVQEPAPEVAKLRKGESWHAAHLNVYPEEATPLEGIAGAALDIECILERGTASAAGLLFRSWNAGGEGSAVVVYDWERNVLEAIFEGGPNNDMATQTELDLEAENVRRVGGPVDMRPGEPVQMRILLDHSCIEVYLGSGEVLSTRIYRGHPPRGADAGIDFVAYGGTAKVDRVEAWEMRDIWTRDFNAEKAAMYDQVYEPVTAVMPVAAPVSM